MRDLATARRRKGGVVRGRRSAISKERNEKLRDHPRPPPATPFSLRPICPYHMLRPGKQLCDCGQGGRGRERPRSVGLSCAPGVGAFPYPAAATRMARPRVESASAAGGEVDTAAAVLCRRFLAAECVDRERKTRSTVSSRERLAAAEQCAAQQLTARTAELAGARRTGLQAGQRLGFALCLRRAWRRACRCC